MILKGKDKEKNNEIDLQFNDYDEENSEEEEEKETIKNEGYLIKFVDNKVKRVWFKLVGKDLFYFKNEKDEIHKGMHNLSGVFIQEEKTKELNGKTFYCFSMTYLIKKKEAFGIRLLSYQKLNIRICVWRFSSIFFLLVM